MSSAKNARASLPARPDLSQLKKQARSLLNAVRGGSSEAFARIAAQHPRLAEAGPTHHLQCRLSDAQLTLAREHGFASWPALAGQVGARRQGAKQAAADQRRAQHRAEQLFAPLALLARSVAWLSRPQLEQLRQVGDWQGLAAIGRSLCPPAVEPELDNGIPEPARVSALVQALAVLSRASGPEPLAALPAAAHETAQACMVVLYAAGYPQLLGQRFWLTQAVTQLGRGEHNQITLHSDGISRSHARIERCGTGFVLVDAGSTNGTFVDRDAEPVVRHTLRDGDRVLLGDAILVFLSGGDLAQKYRDAVAYLDEHDALTRFANREHWLRRTEHGVLLARGEQRPLSLLLFDIDHLARVNRHVGLLGGNSVLATVADILRAALGGEAVVGRTAGGQFGVALPGRDLAASLELAERARASVAERALLVRGERLQITLSVGAATLYRNTGSQELLADALAALRRAKAEGKDRVCA